MACHAPVPDPAPARRGPRGAARLAAAALGAAGLARTALADAPAPDGAGTSVPVWSAAIAALVLVAIAVGAGIARRRARAGSVASTHRSGARSGTVSATERAVLLDPVDAETHEAMDRIADAVRSHDLGDPTQWSGTGSSRQTLPDVVPTGRLLTGAELDAAPRTALREQVRIVSDHNAKLHKVVVAQQASIDSARHTIVHYRSVARRAKDETRTAIEHKRVAVKLARRERAERLRTADEHGRSEAALSNAMALLRSSGVVTDGRDRDATTVPERSPDATERRRGAARGRR